MVNRRTACTAPLMMLMMLVTFLMSLTMGAAQAPGAPPSPLGAEAFVRLRDLAMRSATNATADAAAIQLLGLPPVTEAKEVTSTRGEDHSVFLVVMRNGMPTGDVVLILQEKPGSADEMVHYYLTDSTRQLRSAVEYSRTTRATTKIASPADGARGFQAELRRWADFAKRVG